MNIIIKKTPLNYLGCVLRACVPGWLAGWLAGLRKHFRPCPCPPSPVPLSKSIPAFPSRLYAHEPPCSLDAPAIGTGGVCARARGWGMVLLVSISQYASCRGP